MDQLELTPTEKNAIRANLLNEDFWLALMKFLNIKALPAQGVLFNTNPADVVAMSQSQQTLRIIDSIQNDLLKIRNQSDPRNV